MRKSAYPKNETQAASTTPNSSRAKPSKIREHASDGMEVNRQQFVEGQITTKTISEKRKAALRLLSSGDKDGALNGLLACLKDMDAPGVHIGLRTIILRDINELSFTHPASLAALLDYREAAIQLMGEDPTNRNYALIVSEIDRLIDDDASTIAMLDSLPVDDPRRTALAIGAFDGLLNAKRYEDAVSAKNFPLMLRTVDTHLEVLQRNGSHASKYEIIVESSKDMEALAGAGRIDQAKILLEKLLKIDSSDAAKILLKRRIMKSGYSGSAFSMLDMKHGS